MMAFLCLTIASTTAFADDYTTFLNSERGFTEVTTTNGINDANYYYILTPAESNELIVGIGPCEAKPDWASTESKALRYKLADIDPVLDLTNFFTIEKSGNYIGFRNVVYCADMFQTHDNAGYMYVNTYTDKDFDEWSHLIPTYQNGYWLFESGMYPISSGNWASGYLGPWNKMVAAGEALALNRTNTAGDEAGHYHLFRIAKDNLRALQKKALQSASSTNTLNATWLITNPSFETGDETGWTLNGKDPNGNDEFKTRDYGMSNKDGIFLMNAYQWWATSLSVSQTINDIPSGIYELSGVVATWSGRTVFFTGNEVTVTKSGSGDATGIPVSMEVTIGTSQILTINAGSTAEWWNSGHEGETQTFFKLDDVRLTCKGLFLNGFALPLPNDDTTLLESGQWYYYDVDYSMEYWLFGNINDMVYSTDGDKLIANVSTAATTRQMTLPKGRIYFKTTRSDATLRIAPYREVQELGEFTACALNVDGLPESILFVTLNEDGPQSAGTKKISTYLNNKAYDIMGFSEDFNFDTELRSNMSGYTWGTHRGKITGLTNNTDGLQFACKNSSVTWANETYVAYNSSASTDGNQYIKKGYRHYDATFNGQLIDVYITHMDAGDNSSAITSRGKQWKQLTEAINSSSSTRPKIVMGDTNCRWTRDGIKANFLDMLNSNFTASDVWVEFYRNGVYPTTDMGDLTDQSNPTNYTNYEIVDKIIYINPKGANTLQLVPQSFKIEQDYTYGTVNGTSDTTPLGDHKPVVVTFKAFKSANPIDYYYDVTIGNAKYATLSLPWNATIPEGVTAYTSDDFNPSTHQIELQSVNGILPACTGVILYSDTPNTYRFHFNGNDAEAIEGNILSGTEKGRLAQGERDEVHFAYYVLANRDNHVAMYRLGTATIPQNRAYLKLPISQASTTAGMIERVAFDFDNDPDVVVSEDGGFVDAITTPKGANDDVIGIYAPNGTRLQGMQKGVNIIQMSNGTTKKIIR
ncbi:MAG: hypothetical protein IKX24_12965 [Prevotella sp.]|nr:hypothetical protein [Prevotella sp.]